MSVSMQRASANFRIFDYDFLVGTDADTTFAPECSRRLMATLEEDSTIAGVAGIVRVRFRAGSTGFWTLYQHAEYLRGQVLRRLHQSEVTRQVTCLPGACQMFRVRESTCGDEIMDLFGRHPKDDDGLFSVVRAFGGEDRNHGESRRGTRALASDSRLAHSQSRCSSRSFRRTRPASAFAHTATPTRR